MYNRAYHKDNTLYIIVFYSSKALRHSTKATFLNPKWQEICQELGRFFADISDIRQSKSATEPSPVNNLNFASARCLRLSGTLGRVDLSSLLREWKRHQWKKLKPCKSWLQWSAGQSTDSSSFCVVVCLNFGLLYKPSGLARAKKDMYLVQKCMWQLQREIANTKEFLTHNLTYSYLHIVAFFAAFKATQPTQ